MGPSHRKTESLGVFVVWIVFWLISCPLQKIFVMPNMDDVYISLMHSAMDPRSTTYPLKDPVTEAADQPWNVKTAVYSINILFSWCLIFFFKKPNYLVDFCPCATFPPSLDCFMPIVAPLVQILLLSTWAFNSLSKLLCSGCCWVFNTMASVHYSPGNNWKKENSTHLK